ncbi:coiled-coil domain-containing protein 9B isoform X3, partial [Clarias magur]
KMQNVWSKTRLFDDTRYSFIDPDYYLNIEDYFQNVSLREKSPTDMMLVKKEQKDAELDRKIEALRKKNEALMKRYQGKRVVSEKVEKSSPPGLAGTKHSTEGRGEPLDTTAGRRDCPKSQIGKKQERKYRSEAAHLGFTEYNPYPQ